MCLCRANRLPFGNRWSNQRTYYQLSLEENMTGSSLEWQALGLNVLPGVHGGDGLFRGSDQVLVVAVSRNLLISKCP